MVCHEGRLYVLGGVNNSSQVLSVEIFQCEENGGKDVSVIPVEHVKTSEKKYSGICQVVTYRMSKTKKISVLALKVVVAA